MRPPSTSALALLLATSAQAFRSTSPFLLLSTEPLQSSALPSTQLATAAQVQGQLIEALSPCDADLYVVVAQPGLNAADIREGAAMPRMRRRVLDDGNMYRGVSQISEVVGEIDVDAVMEGLQNKCGIERIGSDEYYESAHLRTSDAALTVLQLPVLHPGEQARKDGLEAADARIEAYLAPIAKNNTKHVVIYISSPPTSAHYAEEIAQGDVYQMDESPLDEAMHTDLKRAVEDLPRTRRAKNEHQKGLPLFERYQFLSPGIFMGLAVSLMLFLLLYVGISAIAGLEVSYMAFSKEMGPGAQNRNKQQ